VPGPSIRVEGADELRRALRYIGDAGLKNELKAAHKSVGQLVAESAIPNVPVRTGRLRASVKALGSQRDARVKAGTARVDYAAAIHWGRKRGGVIVGRPFLWNAAQRAQGRVVNQFERAIDRLLDQIRSR
jgi:hypothetical protein